MIFQMNKRYERKTKRQERIWMSLKKINDGISNHKISFNKEKYFLYSKCLPKCHFPFSLFNFHKDLFAFQILRRNRLRLEWSSISLHKSGQSRLIQECSTAQFQAPKKFRTKLATLINEPNEIPGFKFS